MNRLKFTINNWVCFSISVKLVFGTGGIVTIAVKILLFHFQCLQCFGKVFLIVNQNLNVIRHIISEIQRSHVYYTNVTKNLKLAIKCSLFKRNALLRQCKQ